MSANKWLKKTKKCTFPARPLSTPPALYSRGCLGSHLLTETCCCNPPSPRTYKKPKNQKPDAVRDTRAARAPPAVPERPRTTAQEMDAKDFHKIKSESPHNSRVRVPTALHEDFRAKHFEARIKQQAEVIVPYLPTSRVLLMFLGPAAFPRS